MNNTLKTLGILTAAAMIGANSDYIKNLGAEKNLETKVETATYSFDTYNNPTTNKWLLRAITSKDTNEAQTSYDNAVELGKQEGKNVRMPNLEASFPVRYINEGLDNLHKTKWPFDFTYTPSSSLRADAVHSAKKYNVHLPHSINTLEKGILKDIAGNAYIIAIEGSNPRHELTELKERAKEYHQPLPLAFKGAAIQMVLNDIHEVNSNMTDYDSLSGFVIANKLFNEHLLHDANDFGVERILKKEIKELKDHLNYCSN